MGRVVELTAVRPSYNDPGLDPEMHEAIINAQNASSQNNMKQLGIIVKMYQSERNGYTPPGWLTVYPEFATNIDIFTAPWDAPGTASYELIFPAVHEDDLIALARQLTVDPEVIARDGWELSQVPLVYEVQGVPGARDGRNVLFADGHVEYIRDREWNERIQPYLGR